MRLLLCVLLMLALCVPTWASLTHQPNYTHTKVVMIDYRQKNTPEELDFLGSHADLIIGGTSEGHGDVPGLVYTNYYCVYVGNSEYEDAKAWAARQGVDFEAFFIHYAEATEAKFGSETHILPASSRVPTYNWYGRWDPDSAGCARGDKSWQSQLPGVEADRKSTRLNSSHCSRSRMPSSA